MLKNEVLKAITSKTDGLSVKEVVAVLTAYSELVTETLKKNVNEKVPLPGLGAFSVKDVPERKGVSSLGDHREWVKPAHKEIRFKITPSVKELD